MSPDPSLRWYIMSHFHYGTPVLPATCPVGLSEEHVFHLIRKSPGTPTSFHNVFYFLPEHWQIPIRIHLHFCKEESVRFHLPDGFQLRNKNTHLFLSRSWDPWNPLYLHLPEDLWLSEPDSSHISYNLFHRQQPLPVSEYPLQFHLSFSPDPLQYRWAAVCRLLTLLHFPKSIQFYHNLHPVPKLPEDIPNAADLYWPHVPSAYCPTVFYMDYTGKINDTVLYTRKNRLDHSSILHMGLYEKPVCLLLLSAFPVHLHIF